MAAVRRVAQCGSTSRLGAASPRRWCCGRQRFWAWLLLNTVVLRPLFGWLNTLAFRGWQCPPDATDGTSSRAEHGHEQNDTGLQLLVASAGNSGSTALQAALEVVGVRAYGPEEFTFYAPGLRYSDLASVHWGGPSGLLQSCGVQVVVADLFTMPIVEELIPRSPNAKLLVLRRGWSSWRASKRSTIARGLQSQVAVRVTSMVLLCHWLPLGLIWPVAPNDVGASFYNTGGSLTTELLDYCHLLHRGRQSLLADPTRFTQVAEMLKRLMDSEVEYTRYIEKFRTMVPPERYFESDIGSLGWSGVYSLLNRTGDREGPLPKAKLKGFGKILVRLNMFPWRHVQLFGLLAGSAGLNWLLFRIAWRAACSSTTSRQKKAD